MGILYIVGRLQRSSVWHSCGFRSQEAHLLFCMRIPMSLDSGEIAGTEERYPSSLAHIDRNRRNLLHAEFAAIDMPVLGCDCVERTNRKKARST